MTQCQQLNVVIFWLTYLFQITDHPAEINRLKTEAFGPTSVELCTFLN